MKKLLVITAMLASVGWGQTQVFNNAPSLPLIAMPPARALAHGAVVPSSCTAGQVFILDTTGVIYGCGPGLTFVAGAGAGTVTSLTIAGTTNQINVTGTCTITTTGTCTISLPSNVVLPGTIDGLTITTTTGTFTLTNAKTFTVNNTLTITATDGTTMGLPDPAGVTADHCVKFSKTGSVLGLVDAGAACSSGGGSVFTGSTATNPSFSATPTFSLADVSVKSPVRIEPGALTANVTAVTFTNKTAGAKFSIAWTQDGSGNHTVAYGASATNGCQVSSTASATTTQFFEVGSDGTTVYGTGCIGTDSTLAGPEQAAPGTPASGAFVCWADSTSHQFSCKDNGASTVSNLVVAKDCNALVAGNIAYAVAATGVVSCTAPVMAQNSQSTAYTTVLADAGKTLYHPSADTTARTWTIDSNANVAYAIGTCITFINDTSAGIVTIAITSDTLVLAGAGTTGSRTLAANGVATACKMTSTRWQINGSGLT